MGSRGEKWSSTSLLTGRWAVLMIEATSVQDSKRTWTWTLYASKYVGPAYIGGLGNQSPNSGSGWAISSSSSLAVLRCCVYTCVGRYIPPTILCRGRKTASEIQHFPLPPCNPYVTLPRNPDYHFPTHKCPQVKTGTLGQIRLLRSNPELVAQIFVCWSRVGEHIVLIREA